MQVSIMQPHFPTFTSCLSPNPPLGIIHAPPPPPHFLHVLHRRNDSPAPDTCRTRAARIIHGSSLHPLDGQQSTNPFIPDEKLRRPGGSWSLKHAATIVSGCQVCSVAATCCPSQTSFLFLQVLDNIHCGLSEEQLQPYKRNWVN